MLRIPQRLSEILHNCRDKTRKETSMPLLSVGEAAPAFSVLTHQGQVLTLASLLGKKVLLWFYPKADTPG